MGKQELLNHIYKEIFDALKTYDIKICQNIHELNRFKKTNIILDLSHKGKENIKKAIHTYENEQKEKAITDKFGYREKWKNLQPKKSIRKKELIDEYCTCLERLAELNSELYNMTELYENEYMLDFNHELFNIFKNKLGYYTKLRNKLKELY